MTVNVDVCEAFVLSFLNESGIEMATSVKVKKKENGSKRVNLRENERNMTSFCSTILVIVIVVDPNVHHPHFLVMLL